MATTTTLPPQIWTRVVFQNNTSNEAKLLYHFDPLGGGNDVVPKQIAAYRAAEFKLLSSNSVTYSAYQLENGPKWIVAWILQPNGDNKVYTRIMDQGQTPNTTINCNVDIISEINSKAIAVIDKIGYSPTVTAIIGLPLHHCFA